MHIVQFLKVDGSIVKCSHKTEASAENELQRFADDMSGEFKSIAVVDATDGAADQVLVFYSDHRPVVFSPGDIVRLRLGYIGEGRQRSTYAIVSIDAENEQFTVCRVGAPPERDNMELVSFRAVMPVEMTLTDLLAVLEGKPTAASA